MKTRKSRGETLHEQLTACLADNPQGIPYAQCSRACIEAKMRVKGKNFQKEFEDAIRNKIPKTKALLDGKMSEMGYAISQKMGIAIPFSAAEYTAPRNISQKAESSRQVAGKFAGTWVCNLTLDETIVL